MELKQYILPILKWWWLVILSTGIAAFFSAMASMQSPRIYQTSTTLMVGQVTQDPNPSSGDIQTTQALAASYVQIANRQPVLQGALDALGLPMSWGQLAGQVNVSVVPGTQLIEIRVIDTNPNRAKILADAIAAQLIAQSPTPNDKAQTSHRQFVDNQLKDLEKQIEQTKADIVDLERSMASESSARKIQDLQSQIAAKQTQLNIWQTNYGNLLTFVKGGTNFLSVIEPASVPSVPIGPRTDQNLLVAGAIGLVLSVAAAYLLEYLDDTIKTPADIQNVVGLAALGTILRIRKVRDWPDSLVVIKQPQGPIAEAYRVLRTNLQFSGMKNPAGTLLVTSTVPQEGKTTTAANLGAILAQGQKRVTLVDADLHRPSIHLLFGISNKVGLTSLILDESLGLDDVLQQTELAGLRVLTSGPLPANPADVLSSAEMSRIIDRLRENADLVIFDSPPVLGGADAAILAGRLMSTLIVVDAGKTRSEAVRRAVEVLQKVNAKLVGVVLNKMKKTNMSDYYYSYDSGGKRALGRSWFWQGMPRRTKPTEARKSDLN